MRYFSFYEKFKITEDKPVMQANTVCKPERGDYRRWQGLALKKENLGVDEKLHVKFFFKGQTLFPYDEEMQEN